ncbi:cytochrome b/b6 domain-containing protein [Metallumcola ferriviriculae]|uniref:Cytochrome b/b6 domain-containing protein n=1 Tax=Metallumcola ferriviriculae TaxID=3039180 RepID=A0AAU0UTG3_9FIRM|nr:cytochrome b/b6 domain-containing protein [Desulfitibacteraceae bacterium MK1]
MTGTSTMYKRWDIHQRLQHYLTVISFLSCAVTGIVIKFAYTTWAQSFAKLFGNFNTLFAIHLAGAVIMIIAGVYHLFYLVHRVFKGNLRGTMLPVWKDLKDFALNICFYCGLTRSAPQFAKYSYKEKIDYLAEYWGTPLMIITGLILLYPGKAIAIMPRWVIECSHFAHQGEGMLAFLVIFTWHIYAVHFSLDFFPMNNVWLTGKVSREVMEHEYPLELALIENKEGSLDGREVPQQPSATH